MYKSKFNRAKIICKSLKDGSGVYQSCRAAGVSAMSFWRWRKDNSKFNAFVERILESRTQHVVDALYKKTLEGNVTAMIFWLVNNAPDKWKRHDVINNTIINQTQNDTRILAKYISISEIPRNNVETLIANIH